MHSHYCEPSLTVETLADKCGISNEYFRRLYKSVYNSLPLCDLNSLRTNRACAILRSGYYNTGTVAEECGFTSAKYFRNVFKHYMITQLDNVVYCHNIDLDYGFTMNDEQSRQIIVNMPMGTIIKFDDGTMVKCGPIGSFCLIGEYNGAIEI